MMVITHYTANKFSLEELRVADFKIRIIENVGLITGRTIMRGQIESEPFEGEFRYRDIYVRRSENWRLIGSQLTPITKKGLNSTS